jgi:hypothetical protein
VGHIIVDIVVVTIIMFVIQDAITDVETLAGEANVIGKGFWGPEKTEF